MPAGIFSQVVKYVFSALVMVSLETSQEVF